MKTYLKIFNNGIKKLRGILSTPKDHKKAMELFLLLHSLTHSASVSKSKIKTCYDDLWEGLSEDAIRRTPRKNKFSIAMNLWHITRIEDITISDLIAGKKQIFETGKWQKKLNATIIDTGNAMTEKGVAEFSEKINIKQLKKYRDAVGKNTRSIIKKVTFKDLNRKVDSKKLEKLLKDGYVLPEAKWLLAYWGRKTCSGLLLMPPTRHNLVHINKSMRLKARFEKKI
jgi:hypothetical protein